MGSILIVTEIQGGQIREASYELAAIANAVGSASGRDVHSLVLGGSAEALADEFSKKGGGTVTLFAFDAGQALSEHTAPFDALVQVVDGVTEVTIGGQPVLLRAGEAVLMPADIPHAVTAVERFKMLLVMVKN